MEIFSQYAGLVNYFYVVGITSVFFVKDLQDYKDFKNLLFIVRQSWENAFN